jgi:hypothetical protein
VDTPGKPKTDHRRPKKGRRSVQQLCAIYGMIGIESSGRTSPGLNVSRNRAHCPIPRELVELNQEGELANAA